VTIALGFVYDAGVLLCADSQFTVGSVKMDGMKLGRVDGDWGTVVATFAGNVDFATAAFQRFECEVAEFSDDPVVVLEKTLAKFYRTHVFHHPNYDSGDYDYQILLAIKIRTEPETRLYVATDTVMRQTGAFCCIGAGEETASPMLRYLCSPERHEPDAIALASYVLSTVKRGVESCGGISVIHTLRHDGTFEDHTKSKIAKHIENVSGWFGWQAQRFMLMHTCGDSEFQERLKNLTQDAVHMRTLWKAMEAAQPNPQPTTADPSHQPPSQASP
jgi:20S proteasome alpha/beta subunit